MRSLYRGLALTFVLFSGSLLVGQQPEPKAKGQLPMNWKQLGLSEEQTQKVYKVQNKYGDDIDKLEAQIKELKTKLTKERYDLLTPEQKKKLEEILKGKTPSDK